MPYQTFSDTLISINWEWYRDRNKKKFTYRVWIFHGFVESPYSHLSTKSTISQSLGMVHWCIFTHSHMHTHAVAILRSDFNYIIINWDSRFTIETSECCFLSAMIVGLLVPKKVNLLKVCTWVPMNRSLVSSGLDFSVYTAIVHVLTIKMICTHQNCLIQILLFPLTSPAFRSKLCNTFICKSHSQSYYYANIL